MRIAIVYDVPYPWHVGGIEAMHYNAAAELAKKHEVHFFTTRWPGMENEFIRNGVHYHALHDTDQSRIYRHGRRSVREALFFNSATRRLFGYDFDVIITDYFPMLHLPLVKLYCRVKGAKLIVDVSEYWDTGYWRGYLGTVPGTLAGLYSSSILKGADAYVVISSVTKAKMVKAGIPAGSISIFAPVIDQKEYAHVKGRRRSSASGKTVLFSGRMIKEKRLDKWLDVIREVRSRGCDANGIIMGSGPEEKLLRGKVKKLGLENHIRIKDFYKSKIDYYRQLKSASLLLNMSEREGLSIIAIEGAALGVPVLLPSYSPIPEEVKEMCVVAEEKMIPDMAVKILQSRNPKQFIGKKENIKRYLVSETNGFYSRLFRRLGLRHGRSGK